MSTTKPSSVESSLLFCYMQGINLMTLSLLLTPIALGWLGLQTHYSTEHDYLFSIEQFLPDPLIKLWFRNETIPIQTLTFQSLTIYFPGVAIECCLGMAQGVCLGLDLVKTPARGRLRTPLLHATTLFLYAGMCISALPLHCLKDLVDITTNSLFTQSLFWVDTFCTSCVPPLMLLAGLIESDVIPTNKFHPIWLLVGAVVDGIMTSVGVFYHQRWIMFCLHIFSQTVFLFPLLRVTYNHISKMPHCEHGYYRYMVLAKVCSLVCAYSAFSAAAPLAKISGGAFCPLTSVFVGCRIGMVQYWVYCKKEADFRCSAKDEKTD